MLCIMLKCLLKMKALIRLTFVLDPKPVHVSVCACMMQSTLVVFVS